MNCHKIKCFWVTGMYVYYVRVTLNLLYIMTLEGDAPTFREKITWVEKKVIKIVRAALGFLVPGECL